MKKQEFQTVDFSGGGDGITALYIDGELYKYGDWYHDKIDTALEWFVKGIKHALGNDAVVDKKMIHLHEDHPLVYDTWELGNPPPDKLSDINIDDRRDPNEDK